MPDDPLSDAELDELEALTNAASPAPWVAETGPAIGGPDFIMITDYDDSHGSSAERVPPRGDSARRRRR